MISALPPAAAIDTNRTNCGGLCHVEVMGEVILFIKSRDLRMKIYRILALVSLLQPWASSPPLRTASNTRKGPQSCASLVQPLLAIYRGRGNTANRNSEGRRSKVSHRGRQTFQTRMSRRFRKAYEYARACARGRPPYPKERIYLCNWYVKLVKPGKEIPSNQVQCHVPMK